MRNFRDTKSNYFSKLFRLATCKNDFYLQDYFRLAEVAIMFHFHNDYSVIKYYVSWFQRLFTAASSYAYGRVPEREQLDDMREELQDIKRVCYLHLC